MANYGAGVRLNTSELDRLARALKTNARDIATAFAFQVEAAMKQDAPVDTGACRASIYTVTQEVDGFSGAASAAKSSNPNASVSALPRPSGKVIAHVGPSVEYAIYLEYGTSRMAARPFVIPAVESMAAKFNSGETWKRLFE
jgi:HK97 gp10 family phage protein